MKYSSGGIFLSRFRKLICVILKSLHISYISAQFIPSFVRIEIQIVCFLCSSHDVDEKSIYFPLFFNEK